MTRSTKDGESLKVKRGIIPESSIHFQEQTKILAHLPSWPEVSLLILVPVDCPQHLLLTHIASWSSGDQFGLTVGAPSQAFLLMWSSDHPHATVLMTC